MLGLGSGNKQKVNFLKNGERTRDVQGFSFWVFLRSEPFFVFAAKLRSGMVSLVQAREVRPKCCLASQGGWIDG